MSAPGLARELELQWRELPSASWSALGFRFLDRTLRSYFAQCFDRAGHASTAGALSRFPRIENADCWRRALLMLKAIPEVRASPDIPLLAAFCYVTANLPASLLDELSDVFLRETSTVAIVLSNFSTGTFDVEFQAQRADLVDFKVP